MKYYRINYRRSYYWIDYKLVKTDNGESDALRKTRLNPSKVTEIFEITKEEYETYKQRQKMQKEAEKKRRQDYFIQ